MLVNAYCAAMLSKMTVMQQSSDEDLNRIIQTQRDYESQLAMVTVECGHLMC